MWYFCSKNEKILPLRRLLFHSLVQVSGVAVLALSAHGQADMRYTDSWQSMALERSLFGKKTRMHTAVWPARLGHMPDADSLEALKPWLSGGEAEAIQWQLNPLVDLSGGYSSSQGALYTAAGGVDARIAFRQKWSLQMQIFGGAERLPTYLAHFVDSLGVVPGLGRNRGSSSADVAYLWPGFALSFTPSSFFQLDVGFGSQRFGSGYRSFMLSDVAYNYPYLRITTDVWHFKYTNLFAAMTHAADEALQRSAFEPKYMASHHLSYAISRRVTLSIFESVVWQGRDSLTERSFDPHYLNPVIFYRPVEFAMGSPDRMLIGADLSVRAGAGTQFYGQLVFDEFLLAYLRERTGWWANKWAVQLGVTSYDPFGINGLRFQAEYNVARPFIYSHGSVVQNYAHFQQPLAHPLGSNFREAVIMLHYDRGPWFAETHTVVASYGRDEGPNLGGDLFRSYANPAFEFGNEIGQGLGHDVFFQRITLGRMVYQPMGLRLALRYTVRNEGIADGRTVNEHFFGLHLSTGIRNRYRDF